MVVEWNLLLTSSLHIVNYHFIHYRMGVFTTHMSRETGVILGLIPWFHAFGNLTLFCQTMHGLKMVFLPKFEENMFLGCIET